MKQINWNAEKNQLLMTERGISFADVLFALQSGRLLDDLVHPNNFKDPNQRMFVVEIDEYAWLVPYVENEDEIFLTPINGISTFTKFFFKNKKKEFLRSKKHYTQPKGYKALLERAI
jgi:hypothetical protein